jgi:hypothetical protein
MIMRIEYPPPRSDTSIPMVSAILDDYEEVEWIFCQGQVVGYMIRGDPLLAHSQALGGDAASTKERAELIFSALSDCDCVNPLVG